MTNPAPSARRTDLAGIGLMTFSMGTFAITDALIKELSGSMPIGQVMLWMGLVSTTVFWVLARSQGQPVLTRWARHPVILTRSACEMVGTLGITLALSLAPLATVTAIFQATPLLVTMGGALFLGEKVGLRRWTAILIGLFGVLLIIQPWGAGFTPETLLAVIGAIGLSGRDLATRVAPREVPTFALGVYGSAAVIPAGLIQLSGDPNPIWPTPWLWFLMIACVTSVVMAYYAVTASVRVAPLSVVNPFRYSRLVFALFIAVLFFGETPDALTLIGASIVIGTGLYTLWRESRLAAGQR